MTDNHDKNPEDLFSTDNLLRDLKGRAVRGGAITLTSQPVKFLLNLGSVVILARILVPEDFGLVAMVVVVTGFMGMFKDIGLSMATVQKKDITNEQISTVFWINVALSALLTAVIAALAPVLVWFYGEPRLFWITIALSAGFMFQGLAIQHQALLRRNMRFGKVVGVGITSQVVSIAAAVVAALYGAGYWALVVKALVAPVIWSLGMWVMCPWAPSLPVRGSGVRPMISFGLNFAGSQMFPYLTRNVDKMLIGWYWGAAPLGFYQKAYGLLLMPVRQITPPIGSVMMPALSRLQDKPARFISYYKKTIMMMTAMGMPLVAFCFVAADEVILLFLGSQWTDSIPIFRALIGAAFAGTFNIAMGLVYVPFGKTDRLLRWNIFNGALNVLTFVIAVPHGMIAVALAHSIVSVLSRPFALAYCYRHTPMKLRYFGEAIAIPASASILSAAATFLAAGHLLPEGMHLALRLALMLLFYMACYALLWITLPSGRQNLLDIKQVIQGAFFKRYPMEKTSQEAV